MNCLVYMIRHTESDRLYVGQTTCGLEERWRQHVKRAFKETRKRTFLYNAIRKYGPEAFELYVLEECETRDELNASEKKWIAALCTIYPDGFNLTSGGDASEVSEATRRNMSAAQLRTRANWTPEQLRRPWDALSPERQREMIERIVASRLSKETFEDRSTKMKSIWASKTPEERKAWRQAVVAGLFRNHSATERSEIARRAASSPEAKVNRGKATKEAWAKKTPEHRSQIAAKGLARARAKIEAMPEAEKAEFFARRATSLRANWAARKASKAKEGVR
jgi:group I intron endonuclease